MLHNMTLTSQKRCQCNNKFDCSETNSYNIPQGAINEVYDFSIKYHYSDILLKYHKLHLLLIVLWILTELNPHSTELIFLMPIGANKMELFRT